MVIIRDKLVWNRRGITTNNEWHNYFMMALLMKVF